LLPLVQECLSAQAAAARQAETCGHDAAQATAAVDRLTARLAEETAKTTALRQDLAAITQQQVCTCAVYWMAACLL
jgi:hypothetical protein